MNKDEVTRIMPDHVIEFLGNSVGHRLIMDGISKKIIIKEDMRQAANHLATVDDIKIAHNLIETSSWFRCRIRVFARNYIKIMGA